MSNPRSRVKSRPAAPGDVAAGTVRRELAIALAALKRAYEADKKLDAEFEESGYLPAPELSDGIRQASAEVAEYAQMMKARGA